MNDLMTTTEVATVLGVSVAALRRWRREGTGPQWLRIGRLVRYSPAAVEEWLRASVQG